MTTQIARARPSRKAFWLRQLHTWHWVSSGVSLIGLLLFTVTGFTLNHASEIEGSPASVEKAAQLPPVLLRHVAPALDTLGDTRQVSALVHWLLQNGTGADRQRAERLAAERLGMR